MKAIDLKDGDAVETYSGTIYCDIKCLYAGRGLFTGTLEKGKETLLNSEQFMKENGFGLSPESSQILRGTIGKRYRFHAADVAKVIR